MSLDVENLNVFYGDFHVLHDVSITVEKNEAVALVGPNGHGKSTLLKALCGLLPVKAGAVRLDGEQINGLKPPAIVQRGLVYVAEERNLFGDMSVRENLMLGAYAPRARKIRDKNLELVFELYPRLGERQSQSAKTLSGGEAQMLALGRGLMSSATCMAIDEPSLGLAPNLVETMLETIGRINKSGVTILLVEQNEAQLESLVKRIYRLEEGHVVSNATEDSGDAR